MYLLGSAVAAKRLKDWYLYEYSHPESTPKDRRLEILYLMLLNPLLSFHFFSDALTCHLL